MGFFAGNSIAAYIVIGLCFGTYGVINASSRCSIDDKIYRKCQYATAYCVVILLPFQIGLLLLAELSAWNNPALYVFMFQWIILIYPTLIANIHDHILDYFYGSSHQESRVFRAAQMILFYILIQISLIIGLFFYIDDKADIEENRQILIINRTMLYSGCICFFFILVFWCCTEPDSAEEMASSLLSNIILILVLILVYIVNVVKDIETSLLTLLYFTYVIGFTQSYIFIKSVIIHSPEVLVQNKNSSETEDEDDAFTRIKIPFATAQIENVIMNDENFAENIEQYTLKELQTILENGEYVDHGIVVDSIEEYLNGQAFIETFHLTKEQFRTLPDQRQNQLLIEARLTL